MQQDRPSLENKKEIYTCDNCGSTDILVKALVNPNKLDNQRPMLLNDSNGAFLDGYCRTCKMYIDDVITKKVVKE